MAGKDGTIKSFDYIHRGKGGTDYYGVRVIKADANRLTPVGYIVRLRPNENAWAGFIRSSGEEPRVFTGNSPDSVKRAIEDHFLKGARK